jgi:hypothetical protein
MLYCCAHTARAQMSSSTARVCEKSATNNALRLTLPQRRLDRTPFWPAMASHLRYMPGLRTVSFTSTLRALCAHLPTYVDQKFGEG